MRNAFGTKTKTKIYHREMGLKIQLIHPPHPAALEDRLDAPLGLLYVGSTLQEEGHDVTILDLSGIKRDDWKISEADIYGITSFLPTLAISADIAQACKEKNPAAKIVGGGINFTSLVEMGLAQYIPKEFDSIIIGPGELAMVDLVADMPNIKRYYSHPIGEDLDSLPAPDYRLVDLKSYKRKIDGKLMISTLTSRGCPMRCSFCIMNILYKTIKFRSPEVVAEEIQQIIEKYGCRSFNFMDDTFLIDKPRTHRLLKLLEPLKISFRCHGRVGFDTEDDYVRLKKAGCRQICWGIESGSQFILDQMNKHATVKGGKQVIAWAKKLEILDRIFLVVGFPGESEKTLDDTRRFVEETDPSQYFVSTFQPYPGTDVWKNPIKYGVSKIYRNFSHYIQVYGNNQGGGCNIDTMWASRAEMNLLEDEFRQWIGNRVLRNSLQDYEQKRLKYGESKNGI